MVTSQFSPGVPLEALKDEVGKIAGMMPIKISVPQQGRLVRFSKLLITEKESPWVSFRYVKVYRHLGTILRLIALLGVVVLIIRWIRKRREQAPAVTTV